MSRTEAFIIPQGLHFEHTAQGLVIEHQGDIVLRGSLGTNVHRLISTDGNIHLERPLDTGEISALNGCISSDSPLTASRISAKQLEVGNNLTVHKQLHISKSIHVHGDITANRIQSLGNLEVSGSVRCDEFYSEGTVSILHNLECQNAEAQDAFTVEGHAHCNTLTLGADTVQLGQLTAQTLTALNTALVLTQGASVPAIHVRSLQSGGSLQCKTIQASEDLHLSEANIHADVVFCNRLKVEGTVGGKILVLECSTQQGAHHIKGCLELSDFADLVPNIDDFLTERGLTPPSQRQPLSFPNTPETDEPTEDQGALHVNLNAVSSEQAISEEEAPPLHEDPDHIPEEDTNLDAQPARIAVPLVEADEPEEAIESNEEITESTSLSEVDAAPITSDEINLDDTSLHTEPLSTAVSEMTEQDDIVFESSNDVEALNDEINIDEAQDIDHDEDVMLDNTTDDSADNTEPVENPLFEEIRTQINTLASAYDTQPAGIVELLGFLESNDFLLLREDLKPIWSSLMKFHQQENSRIPPTALQAFTKLDKLLKNL